MAPGSQQNTLTPKLDSRNELGVSSQPSYRSPCGWIPAFLLTATVWPRLSCATQTDRKLGGQFDTKFCILMKQADRRRSPHDSRSFTRNTFLPVDSSHVRHQPGAIVCSRPATPKSAGADYPTRWYH